MSYRPPPWPRRYGSALLFVALATLVRAALDPLFGDRFPFAPFLPAVLAAAWAGGVGPGLAAIGLSVVAGRFFFVSPRWSFFETPQDQQETAAVFGAVGLGIAALGATMRQYMLEAERATDAERVQREQLQITLRSIGDAVIVTDAAGRVTLLNAVAEALTGWPAADAVGQPLDAVFDIVNEHTRAKVENPAARALAEGVVVGLANHTILRSRTGAEYPIDDSAAPIRDAAGALVGAVLVFRDITERKAAEAAVARAAAIVESSDDAIISKTLDGVVRSWNPGAERLFGYSPAEAVGRPIALIIPPDRLPEEEAILARLRRGEPIDHFETVRLTKDGRLIDISVTISPTRDGTGRIVGASKVARDVTARKAAEAAVRASERRQRFLADLAAATQALADPAAVVAVAADRLADHLAADSCAYAEVEAGATFVVAGDAPRNGARSLVGRWAAADFGPAVLAALAANEPVVIDDVAADPRAAGPAYQAAGIRAAVAVPLHKDGALTAVMGVYQLAPRRWAADEVELVRTVVGRCWEALERTRAVRALQESEARYRAIVEASPECVKVLAPDGTVLQMNSAGAAMVEAAGPDAVRGRCVYDLVAPEDRDAYRAFNERVCHGEPGTLAFDLVSLNGARRHMETAAVPLPAPGGGFHHLAVTRDVTARRAAEEQQRQRDERLKLLVDRARDYAVVIADKAGVVVEWAGGAETITGFAAADVVGRPIGTFFTPEDRAAGVPERELATAARDGRAEDKRWHVRKDGSEFYADGVLVPLRDDGGALRGFGKVFRDATARKRAEDGARFLVEASASLAELVDYESTLQRIANLAVGGFADWCVVDVLDPGGKRRRLAVTTVETPAVAEVRAADSAFEADSETFAGVPHVLRTGEPEYVFDLAALGPDAPQGPDRVARLRAWGIRSYLCVPFLSRGRVIGGMTFLSSSTRRRFGRDELRVAQDLAERVTIAIENAQLYRALQDADRRKDEFLATLAHELRNPLAPVRNGLQILRSGRAAGDVFDRTVAMMTRQLGHMVHLVDDLLDVSRVSSGKVVLRKERVELRAVVDSAVETSRQTIEAAGHELVVALPDEPLAFDADRTRLAQVFANLLNNAAKYTERGGRITLTAERNGPDAVVRVADTGVGIPAEMLPKVFDMFAQVGTSLERSQGGLGIGLTLVRRLVEMHGGSVTATSDGPGRGSTFTVCLPLAEAPAAAGGPEPAAPAAGGRLAILVVDDNHDAADSLALLLGLKGHDVRTAHDGPEALRTLETFRPQVILLDIGLPGMNGYEVARRIRASAELAGVTLAALTGWGQDEDRRRSKAAGFDHHLVKPVDPHALLAVVAARAAGPPP